MKLLIVLIASSWELMIGSTSIYDINATTVAGDRISLGTFSNKKLLITCFDAGNPSVPFLQRLDSIQAADTSLTVIAVPAEDFSGSGDNASLKILNDSLALHILMLQTSFVKKEAAENQDPLFNWLTSVDLNTHFNLDVETVGEFFIVNKDGILYGVLAQDTQNDVLSQVLTHDIEQND